MLLGSKYVISLFFISIDLYIALGEPNGFSFSLVLHFCMDRYFVVIDDIWEAKSWEQIKWALGENNCGNLIQLLVN